MDLNLVNYDKAVMLKAVSEDFSRLANTIYSDMGITITAVDSYKYEWEIVDELRKMIKSPEIRESLTQLSYATGSLITNLITEKNSLLDLVKLPTQEAVNTYSHLKDLIQNVPSIEFEPPLGQDFTSMRSVNEIVYTIPNYPNLDPRRSGRIVRIGPKASIHATTLKYLLLNAGKYGFVFYGPKDPSVWYWRGDKLPLQDPVDGSIRDFFTPYETAATFSPELVRLLPRQYIPIQSPPPPITQPTGPAIIQPLTQSSPVGATPQPQGAITSGNAN